ncbi:MAG: class I SAM-dependent methyltransferase [Candidatus Izemoplasmatales bacterium]
MHYYSSNQDDTLSNVQEIKVSILGKSYTFETDHGVFSMQGLDFGTRVLLEAILSFPMEKVLDLGAGYGPIAIIVQKVKGCKVTSAEINERAWSLSKSNARKNKAIIEALHSDGFEKVVGEFDTIITNPPIRAGKSVYYPWFHQAKAHLVDGGRFFLVIQKKQGAPSAIKELEGIFPSVEVIEKKSGYYVIKCEK